MMLDRGYTLITLDQFHDFIDGTSGVPDKSVLITFDDGYEDNYTLAYPVAKKYSVPAVIFPVTKWFSDYPRPEPHRPHMTLEQAISLEEEGLWDFGSHSHDGHRKIPGETGAGPFFSTLVVQPGYRESDGEFKARIWADVSLSMYTLEKMGIEQVDFAFPYGSYNDMAKQVLTAAGYKYLYTNEPGINEAGQDPNHIYRISSAYTAEGNLALLDYYFSLK
jgi:biofilm PGA synthesis lipoprotein PgaB